MAEHADAFAQPPRPTVDVAGMRPVDLRPIALALLLITGGCIAAPPLHVSGAVGGAVGNVPSYNRADTLRVEGSATGSNARVLATPLSMTRDPLARSWDVGLGWTADLIVTAEHHPFVVHGPVADIAWFTHVGEPTSDFRWRWGPFATAEVFLNQSTAEDTTRGQGYGAAMGLLVESVMEARHTGAMSASRGELAIGLSARAGVRHIDGETHGVVLFAVEARFPGFIGVHLPVLDARPRSAR